MPPYYSIKRRRKKKKKPTKTWIHVFLPKEILKIQCEITFLFHINISIWYIHILFSRLVCSCNFHPLGHRFKFSMSTLLCSYNFFSPFFKWCNNFFFPSSVFLVSLLFFYLPVLLIKMSWNPFIQTKKKKKKILKAIVF